MSKYVLSVGQCGPDHAAISRFLKSHFDVMITSADSASETLDLLQKRAFDLVLINRKLDLDYSDGLEIIRLMKSRPDLSSIPVMLVSNYADAHAAAVALGAISGFGKQELTIGETADRLRAYLGTA
jgi:CheY-like chemotaxis protein